jgi:hypothetical protein
LGFIPMSFGWAFRAMWVKEYVIDLSFIKKYSLNGMNFMKLRKQQ